MKLNTVFLWPMLVDAKVLMEQKNTMTGTTATLCAKAIDLIIIG